MPVILACKTVDLRKAYRTKFSKLLQYELDLDMKSLEDRVLHWSVPKLKSEGLALFHMKAEVSVRTSMYLC